VVPGDNFDTDALTAFAVAPVTAADTATDSDVARVALVPYWKVTFVSAPFGFTSAPRVAVVVSALADPVVALGFCPVTENERDTVSAALYRPSDPRVAAMVQVPTDTSVTVEPETVQTDGVVDANDTAPPELALALSVNAGSDADLSAKVPKVIDCGTTPTTVAGVSASELEPLPICPEFDANPPAPQHLTMPEVAIEHAKELPAATTAASVIPETDTGARTD
jgi:hypothetical protein